MMMLRSNHTQFSSFSKVLLAFSILTFISESRDLFLQRVQPKYTKESAISYLVSWMKSDTHISKYIERHKYTCIHKHKNDNMGLRVEAYIHNIYTSRDIPIILKKHTDLVLSDANRFIYIWLPSWIQVCHHFVRISRYQIKPAPEAFSHEKIWCTVSIPYLKVQQ